jgi:DNA-binding transcriptional MerR regulator
MKTGKWLNTYKISELSEIPYTTARRILLKHSTFFDYKKRGRSRLYKQDQIPLLQEINQLYKEGMRYNEINENLRKSEPETVEMEEEGGILTTQKQPANSLYKTLEIIGNQKQQLDEQRKQILSLVDKVENLENVNKEKSEEIRELKKVFLAYTSKRDQDKNELLKEINEMLLEFMKNNR